MRFCVAGPRYAAGAVPDACPHGQGEAPCSLGQVLKTSHGAMLWHVSAQVGLSVTARERELGQPQGHSPLGERCPLVALGALRGLGQAGNYTPFFTSR